MADNSALLEDFETFKENFCQAIRDENIEIQLGMTKKLSMLAEHLGEELTRTELVPFLNDYVDLHSEVLLNLSEQLKGFVRLVGGYEYSQPVLDILRKLCHTDENVVRDRTVETLRTIAGELDPEQTEKLLIPLLEDLINEDWFTSKSSAAAIIPIIYSKVKDEYKESIMQSFQLLARDEVPLVRKAAALYLLDLIPTVEKDVVVKELAPLFYDIAKDDSAFVQLHTIRIGISLCKSIEEESCKEDIFKTLEEFVENPSWKMRQVLALNIADIQETVQDPRFRGRTLALYQKLAKDSEVEVRMMAVKMLVKYCQHLKSSYKNNAGENNFEWVFVESIVPLLNLLVIDPSVDVKMALATNIFALKSVIDKNGFVSNIMPLVGIILEEDNAICVKAALLEHLNELPDDVDLAASLPSIRDVIRTLIVYSQSHWRTRRGLLVTFMHLTRFASKDYFAKNLEIFYATLLNDPVFAVRRTAPLILPLLARLYGVQWTAKEVLPYFANFRKDNRYLYRYNLLFAVNELVNPSLFSRRPFTKLKDSSTPKLLYKCKCLANKLNRRLEEALYKDILACNIDDYRNDDIKLYAEDSFATLQTYSNEDIYPIENENSYTPELISILLRELMDLIVHLFYDNIVNVQKMSIFTLNKIKQLAQDVNEELEDPSVVEAMGSLTEEDRVGIEKDVELEINERVFDSDDDSTLIEKALSVEESLNTSLQSAVSDADSKANSGKSLMNTLSEKVEQEIARCDDDKMAGDDETPAIVEKKVVEDKPSDDTIVSSDEANKENVEVKSVVEVSKKEDKPVDLIDEIVKNDEAAMEVLPDLISPNCVSVEKSVENNS